MLNALVIIAARCVTVMLSSHQYHDGSVLPRNVARLLCPMRTWWRRDRAALARKPVSPETPVLGDR